MAEDDAPPPPPAPIAYAPPPSASQLTREALQAQIDYAPQFLKLNQEQLPQMAQLQTDIQRQQAPQLAQINVDTQRLYGPQLIDLALEGVKRADPTGFALRESLGQQVQKNLNLGGALSPDELRIAHDDLRSAQVARGNGTGAGDAIEESAFLANQRFGRQQQAIQNAMGFINGKSPDQSFQSNNVAGRTSPVGTQDVNSFAQMAPSASQLVGAQLQGYGQQSANIGQQNALANNQFQYHDQNTSNPFLTGLSAFGSFVGQVAGGVGGRMMRGGV